MTTKNKKRASADQVMRELVHLAETDFNNDRRSEARYPFFRPVSVDVGGRSFSAFTREISSSALGMLHNMELPLNEVGITLAGQQQRLLARIERCEPCGEGWYISGCTIVGMGA